MAYAAFRTLAILSLGLLWGGAQAQVPEADDADPPGRAARLSHVEGEVSMQPAGEADWGAAFVNRPLTTGDKLWTEDGARAEIHVGPAAIRLDGNTGFSFLEVDDDSIHMRITAGVMNVTVLRLDGREQLDIATPNVALGILRTDTYRVEVNDAGDRTVVKVTEGAIEATGPMEPVLVHAGQSVTFEGTDQLVAHVGALGPTDAFDAWSRERARRDESAATSRTAQYVSPDVTGYEELDDHGDWVSEPEYGYVWTPRYVAVDWAPYRFGRWVWVGPWGWTWIDDYRWGYAPFHYGRWAYIGHRWCWVPGPRHHRAVFAPALVGWIGTPGYHTWYPLGPRDVYMPWRHHSWRYMERVNAANAAIAREHIRHVFQNRNGNFRQDRVPRHGITAASRVAFTSAGHVRDHRVRLNDRDFGRNVVRTVAPDVKPGREARLGGSRAHARAPSRAVTERPVVVRRAPPERLAGLVRAPAARDRLVTERPRRETLSNPSASWRERSDRPPRENRQSLTNAQPRDGTAERLREFRERDQTRPAVGASLSNPRRDRDLSRPSPSGIDRSRFESAPRADGNVRRWATQESRAGDGSGSRPQARESVREYLPRQAERPRVEQRTEQRGTYREASRPQSQPQPRPQVSQPRPQVSQPRVERAPPPRVEHAPRSEAPRASSESRGASRGNSPRSGGFAREKRH